MKTVALRIITLACAVSIGASAFAQRRPEPLTNASVVKLVRAGFKEKTIIAIIHSRPNKFDLNADRLVELKHSGVTDNIILAMLSQDDSPLSSGDDWNDDAFFKSSQKPVRDGDGNQAGNQRDNSSVDIFGSGGSSRAEQRGRGVDGSSAGDSVITGSATVRILRPPAEEGGGTVKLEKTPTLKNDSIIQLIDAGFSEGTIVKRIEQSPVDFDLSPEKVAELKKHRVTDPIITAMTAAMNDDSGSKSTSTKPQER